MSWIDIGAVSDVPMRGARKIKTALGCVAVFRTGEDEVFAAMDRPVAHCAAIPSSLSSSASAASCSAASVSASGDQ